VERLRGVGPEILPGLLGVGVFTAWSASGGGHDPTALYPGAMFLLGLGAAVLFAYRGGARRIPRPALVALGLVGAFVAWSFLSITWADSQGDAWDGANRALMYAIVFGIFVILPWRPSSAAIVLGVYAAATAAVGAIGVLEAAGSADPTLFFVADRFIEPTGYHNANAALFLGAFWPALFLASRAEVPWPLRGLMLATAGLLLQLALLPQSRGSLIAAPITLILYLILVPARGRTLIALVPVAATLAVTADPLLDLFSVVEDGGDVEEALDTVVRTMALSFAALTLVGALIGASDRAISLSEGTARVLGRAANVGLAASALAGIVVAVAVIGNPVSWADDRWQDFKAGEEQEFSGSRLGGGLGSNRYDFWRVAADEFADSPVNGIGAENFAQPYLRERDSLEEPFDPHSLPLKLLSQTGIVGAALFASFIVLAAIAALRATRGATGLGRGITLALVVAVAYWLIHSAGDWFWLFPAVSAPAFAWLGMAARVGAGGAPDGPPPAAPRQVAAWALTAAVLLFSAASFGLPWAAARDVEIASESWGADPEAAYDRLERARKLNFLSARPDLVAGAIAAREGDRARVRESFTQALDRAPGDWYPLLELGVLDSIEGDRAAAISRLRAAREANPRDPLIRETLRRVRAGEDVSLRSIDRALLEGVCALVGRTHGTEFCPRE
jgi:hypothetical protein